MSGHILFYFPPFSHSFIFFSSSSDHSSWSFVWCYICLVFNFVNFFCLVSSIHSTDVSSSVILPAFLFVSFPKGDTIHVRSLDRCLKIYEVWDIQCTNKKTRMNCCSFPICSVRIRCRYIAIDSFKV